MPILIKAGSTSRDVDIALFDATTGLRYTTGAFGDAGISLWYRRGLTGAKTAITPATQTVTGAYSSGGFVHIGDGIYRLDAPDAAFASGVDKVQFGGSATAWTAIGPTVQLVGFDPRTDAVATVAGSLDVNLKQWLGTAAATPNTAGVPLVDVVRLLGTLFTESAAGRLVANIKTFFNVSGATGTQDDLTTLTGRLTSARAGYLDALAGWTGTIRQALRALAAKAAGESSSDLTGGSSTYNNTTDSQEAIRDNMSSGGVTAADVWTYTSRSLTTPVAASTDGTLAGAITRKRGDRWSIQRTALGAVTGYTTLWFTLKDQTSDADTSAVLQATVAGGLVRLNGSTSVTSGHVTITVDDASTGDITIVVLPAATAQLAPRAYEYDVQVLIGSAVTTLEQGRFTVTADITRAVS